MIYRFISTFNTTIIVENTKIYLTEFLLSKGFDIQSNMINDKIQLKSLSLTTIVIIMPNEIRYTSQLGNYSSLGYARLKIINLLEEESDGSYDTYKIGPILYDIVLLNQTNNILFIYDKIALVTTTTKYTDYGQKYFDLKYFMGTWFYEENIIVFTKRNDKCVIDIYENDTLTKTSVAYIEDPDTPWLITIKGLFVTKSVIIHETDYNTYALLGTQDRSEFLLFTRDIEISYSIENRITYLAKYLGYY